MPLYHFEIYDGYVTTQHDAIELQDDLAAHRKALSQAVLHATKSENSAPDRTIIVTVSNDALEDLMIVRLASQTELLRSADPENPSFNQAA